MRNALVSVAFVFGSLRACQAAPNEHFIGHFSLDQIDELIRQITINCSERGLLLLRVRDEARMTIAAYQTLYESSIAFGMRKALMAEQKRMEAEQKIRQLEGEVKELASQIDELNTRCEAVARREEEKKSVDEKKHQEEVEILRKANDQLKASLETMLAAPK